jgi:inosine-uridine nucleoside N-ribohydrolase
MKKMTSLRMLRPCTAARSPGTTKSSIIWPGKTDCDPDHTTRRDGGPTAAFAVEIYERSLENFGGSDAATWDLMAAAIMLDPSLCGFASLPLDVITVDGATSRQTVVVEGGAPNVDVCLSPHASRIKQNFRDVFSASQ